MAATTQLTCPHCGSTLTFGAQVAAGTPVECLICMQAFTADPKAASPASIHNAETPTMSDTKTATVPKAAAASKPKPATGVPVGKPHQIPTATAVSSKPMPAKAKANPDADASKPSLRKPPIGSMGGKLALAAVAAGLGFLLLGGVIFAIVKIARSGSDSQLADNSKKDGQENPGQNGEGVDPNLDKGNPDKGADAVKDDNKGATNAKLSAEEEELIRNKLKEETKQLLKRKVSTDGSGELDWQSVATFNVDKQPGLNLTQQKINSAIDRGVEFLKANQQANGTWSGGHPVGHAAIGGLTLLECQVPANDPTVQRAAAFVRANATSLNGTYELSLAILFLDRLGEARDRTMIQGMAMRLLAGQDDSGGWSYTCPLMTPQEMLQLYNFLHSNKKPSLLDPLQAKNGGLADPLRNHLPALDPTQGFYELAGSPNPNPMPEPKKKSEPKKGKNPPKVAPIPQNALVQNLQNLAIVRNQGFKKGQIALRQGGSDNSNTQFALLALWAARRHDVPTDPAHLAAFQRFVVSQKQDGGWGYHPASGSTNTMTCVGLLGMAMGHGASPEIVKFNPKDPKDTIVKPALEDPRIQTGLQAMARNIGEPSAAKNPNLQMQNLYFMWSVERVAMLYDLKTIGGKDWYSWGAQILVHNQQANGSWPTAHYHGADPPLNTCFALLFLKRSNLVQDLTNNLRLYTGIRDSEK